VATPGKRAPNPAGALGRGRPRIRRLPLPKPAD
jgi:hypothetical protein